MNTAYATSEEGLRWDSQTISPSIMVNNPSGSYFLSTFSESQRTLADEAYSRSCDARCTTQHMVR
jgi:hypothetical protein